MIRAEFTKLRSVRAWLACLAVAVIAMVGLGLAAASGTRTSCDDQKCPAPPTGPGGEAVNDHFAYVHQELDGDGELIAHVVSFHGIITYPPPNHDTIVEGLVPWAKAGLMVKDGTKEGAAYASVLLTGSHGVRVQDDFTGDTAGPATASWLKITREGDRIVGFSSDDGKNWAAVDTIHLAGLPSKVQIGMFVASPSDVSSKASPHGGTIVQARFTQATAVFDQVSRTGKWTFTEVGDNGMQTDWEKNHQPSGFTQQDGRISVSGSGDISPAGREGGASIENILTGLIASLIAVMVVAVLFITGEYRRGLIRTTLAAMPSRGRLIAAKAVVIGAVTFVTGLVAAAVTLPLAAQLMRSNDTIVLPTSLGTRIWLVVGAALLLSLAAVFAYALGAVLRRGVPAIATAVVLLVLPYLLSVSSVLPVEVARWLLRVTPAAAFAFQQTLPAYHQVALPYYPSGGYFPLAPWAGLAVLAAWVAAALGLAVLRIRRGDA